MLNGKWLLLIKRAHLFLSAFFAPMLLLFIVTGWWQTVTEEQDPKDPDAFTAFMQKLSTVHTDDHLARAGHHSTLGFQILVVAMCIALIVSILLGLTLAWHSMKRKAVVVLALALGVLVPALVLYLA